MTMLSGTGHVLQLVLLLSLAFAVNATYQTCSNIDTVGADIQVNGATGVPEISLADCETLCGLLPGCVGGTYFAYVSTCYPKSAAMLNLPSSSIVSTQGATLFFPSQYSTCPQAPFSIQATNQFHSCSDIDTVGADIQVNGATGVPNLSLAACEQLCISLSGCVGGAYYAATSTCYPKSAAMLTLPSSSVASTQGATLFVPAQYSTCPIAPVSIQAMNQFHTCSNIDTAGADLSEFTSALPEKSLAECQALCALLKGCVGGIYHAATSTCYPKTIAMLSLPTSSISQATLFFPSQYSTCPQVPQTIAGQ